VSTLQVSRNGSDTQQLNLNHSDALQNHMANIILKDNALWEISGALHSVSLASFLARSILIIVKDWIPPEYSVVLIYSPITRISIRPYFDL